MTSAFRFIGCCDPVGKGIGFLVPVFDRLGSNAIFIQRVGQDNKIEDFEAVDGGEAPIHHAEPVTVCPGEEAYFAFGFGGDDRLLERNDAFRNALLGRIADPAIAKRPFLAVEVSEFLGHNGHRLTSIKSVLDKTGRIDPRIARQWFDLSVLTTDVREVLQRRAPEYRALAQKIVLTTIGEMIIVRGINLPKEDRKGVRLEEAVGDVLANLEPIYPAAKYMTIKVVELTAPQREQRAPLAVWFADPDLRESVVGINSSVPVPIFSYRAGEVDRFIAAAQLEGMRPFAVIPSARSARKAIGEAVREIPLNTIEFGSSSVFRDQSLHLWPKPQLRIAVSSVPFAGAGRSPSGMVKQVSQILTAIAMIEGNRGQTWTLEGGEWLYLRATVTSGLGVAEAWASLFDRVWQTRVNPAAGFCIEFDGLQSDLDRTFGHRIQEALFPASRADSAPTPERSGRRPRRDVAMLVSARSVPDESLRDRRYAVGRVLTAVGLHPVKKRMRLPDGTGWSVPGLFREIRVAHAVKPELHCHFGDALHVPLLRLDSIAVTCEATPQAVLGHLGRHQELVINMRDLCHLRPSGSVCSLLGSMVRRFSGVTVSHARSQFMALLVNEALRSPREPIADADDLQDLVDSAGREDAPRFHWSSSLYRDGVTSAKISVLSMFRSNLPGPAVMPAFRIFLDEHGIFLGHAD